MLYCIQRDLNMKYKHVILIGIDGAGNFYRNTNAKAIRKMFSEGAGTDRCLTVYPTESAQCWGSMLTGIYPEKHEMTMESTETTSYQKRDEYPTIYRIIRDAIPDAVIGSFSHWNTVNTRIADDGIGITKETGQDPPLADMICEYIEKEKPTFLFIQFDSIDDAGHGYGYNTPKYLEQLDIVDGYVGRIRDAVDRAGIAGDTLVIATADHGGIGGGHGGSSPEEMTVFFVAVGKTVNRGAEIKLEVKDIPAVVAYALGIGTDRNWDAKLPDNLFIK